MKPWQRTIIRLAICAVLLAFLVPHLFQFQGSPKQAALLAGMCLVFIGVVAFIIAPALYKAAPDLDNQLKAWWGYGLPKWTQTPIRILIIVVGIGLISWSLIPN
jgi:membrane protease YdiL (CAAX protease family)